jgi:Uma2 family endonuclease
MLPEADRKKFACICPDFVAEIKSPSDSVRDLRNKMREWMDNGCRLGWLLDQEDPKCTCIRRPNRTRRHCRWAR